MSLPQAAELSITYADFLARMTGDYEDVRWGPAYSTGTRVFAKRDGVWRAFLISNLTAPAKSTKPHPLATLPLSDHTALDITPSTGNGFDIESFAVGAGPGQTFDFIKQGTGQLAARFYPNADSASPTTFEFFTDNPQVGGVDLAWGRLVVNDKAAINLHALRSSPNTPATIVLPDFIFQNVDVQKGTTESFRILGTAANVAVPNTDNARASFASGKTPIQHNRGINEAAPGGALTTKAIVFGTAEENATYGVLVTGQGNQEIWITGKLTTGFTLNYSVAGGVACDWMVFR